jgi:mono/diheme cytochrome c family protein
MRSILLRLDLHPLTLLLVTLAWLRCDLLVAADNAVGLSDATLEQSFTQRAKPFLKQHCQRCHDAQGMSSGIRVDQLDASLQERHLKLWDAVRKQLVAEAMPPEDEPQPTSAERRQMVEWIEQALNVARLRPVPKNGSVRRLTAAQYRNTLRELLLLEDDLAEALPPDAVSRDGFLNNKETLQLSPLLLEAYFQIAEEALDRCVVDVNAKPAIQNFRVDLGASINPQPCPDKLILGANSLLLENEDFVVTQLTPQKPFAFEPFRMQTKYRFIEGYEGNSTVRGWREYDSVYHAVFACMRGAMGYPKGAAYSAVPRGLLLRPAIPSEELFQVDSTYGPRANFKISLRELPDRGQFRVTVTAAKYDDGLLLDPGTRAQPPDQPGAIVCEKLTTMQSVTIPRPGIYQVDLYEPQRKTPVPEASRLGEALIGAWPLDGTAMSSPDRPELTGRLVGQSKFVASPFGQAVSLDGESVVVRRHESMNVGTGDFTVAAWIHPRNLQQGGIVCLGKYGWTHGWYLDMPNNQGILRLETFGPEGQTNGSIESRRGELRNNAWQHVAAVVRRGEGQTRLYVNGYVVATGKVGLANLDNPSVDLHLGRIQGAQPFRGELDEVRMYRRALDEAEIQALVEPGRKFVPKRDKPQDAILTLGDRQFENTIRQPAFLILRLPAGELPVKARYTGALPLERIVFTRLPDNDELARRFETFERRSPRLGVHVGLRRDCGSTLAQVGSVQTVSSTRPANFVFTGAIHNFPSPDVEKDNVNYLAGIREIGVRSEYTDGRDMPRLMIRSVEFEGPFYESWPPEPHRNIFVDFDRKDDRPAYAREIIRRFATRAFRRPITGAEEVALVGVFEKSFGEGARFEESVKHVLRVVLTSPQFLFLVENSSTPAAEPLNDDELASKLSYFLWNGLPDQRLLDLAASGKLRSALNGEVDRLIVDPRFSRFVNEFTSQWLSLDKFDVVEPDRKLFPKLARDTRTQLRQEPVRFVEHLFRNNLPVRNLIESDFVVANESVASYYDLGERTESGFEFAPIKHDRKELGGVFAQAAILAGLSDGRESNPVKRGAWVARRIIAEPPDDPPPNVPALEPESKQLTLRERLERHRNQPGCAQCHAKIDPWGLPFEEFDAGGRLKLEPADARSTLPDKTKVAGMQDLKRYLAHDRIDQVAFSMLKHLATYGTGRTLTYNELEFLKRRGLELKPHGYRMQDMIRFVVTSELFLEK